MTEPFPSKDPADEATLGGAMRAILRKFSQALDVQLPAEVVSYDRESNTATVRPVVALLTTAGAVVPRAQVVRVPVLALGGGGFVINFPLQPGDRGWLEASDRDISLFLQRLHADQPPNTLRLHSFEDGRFVPDVFGDWQVGDVAEDAMTIQTANGATRIEVSPTRVRIVATEVVIDAESTTINGDVDTYGALRNNDVDVGSTHTHGGVQTGGGTSGPPTP